MDSQKGKIDDSNVNNFKLLRNKKIHIRDFSQIHQKSNSMKSHPQQQSEQTLISVKQGYKKWIPLIIPILIILFPTIGQTDCSCQLGSNGIYVIGFELVAQSCPPVPPSDQKIYTYTMNAINCTGGTIASYAFYGDQQGSPSSVIAYYVNQQAKVIRNPSGTHMIVVLKTSYPFSGTIAGINIAAIIPGVYVTSPPEKMNEFCTSAPLPDLDKDKFPDCLDCSPNNPALNATCTDIRVNFGQPQCLN